MISVETVCVNNKDLHTLIIELEEYFQEIYPEEGIFGLNLDSPETKEMIFVIAYYDDIPVGCGAFRNYYNYKIAELKRFFVKREYRNMGIAGKILNYIENKAREKGYDKIILETGPNQPESINFYKKTGFNEIPLYGEYIKSKYSICFEKIL